MKKILGSLLLLSLSLFAKSAYEWKVNIKDDTLYLNQATTLEMKCTFEKEGKNDDVEFIPPKDVPFEFRLLTEVTHFEQGRKIIRYEYLIFAKKVGEFTLNLKPKMLFMTQSAIDNVIVGRDNVNDLEAEKEIAKIAPIKMSVEATGSTLTGTLNLTSYLDKKEVSAYAPVHLEVVIEGRGNLQELKPIHFEIEGVDTFSDEPEAEFALGEDGYSGKWIQRFAFVGKENFSIPPVSLSYFDLVTKKEAVLKSEAFSIKIKEDGLKREELVDKIDLPSAKIELSSYVDYLYYLLSFIAGFIVAKLFKLPQRTVKKERCAKVRQTKNAKELLDVLIVCEKDLFSSEIDDLEKVVYQHDEASLAKIKKRVLKKL